MLALGPHFAFRYRPHLLRRLEKILSAIVHLSSCTMTGLRIREGSSCIRILLANCDLAVLLRNSDAVEAIVDLAVYQHLLSTSSNAPKHDHEIGALSAFQVNALPKDGKATRSRHSYSCILPKTCSERFCNSLLLREGGYECVQTRMRSNAFRPSDNLRLLSDRSKTC